MVVEMFLVCYMISLDHATKVPDMAGKKTRRTQVIVKCFAFHANAIIKSCRLKIDFTMVK